MKQPMETAEEASEAATVAAEAREEAGVSGKTFLRQTEFLEQRGLSRQATRLSINGGAELLAAAETASPYLLGSREKSALLEEAEQPEAVAWRSLGPIAIPNGQTYGSGPGSKAVMAGRITALAVDPTDSDHVLVGSAAGGIWETRDRGGEWTPRTDDQPTLSIGAMAFDTADPATVYAGTGEGTWQYFHLGQGILRSQDGGATWTMIAGDVFADIGFYRLLVDPRDSQRVIAGTTGGAAVSTDGGANWSLLHQAQTWDVSLAYHDDDQQELLLAAADGLFSVDGAGGLQPVDIPDLPALDPDSERMAVSHVPSDPEQVFVFAATQGRARLWRRAAREQPYVPIQLPVIPVPRYLDNAFSVQQASYDWHLSIPPGSDDLVYVGAIELLKGERNGNNWSWSDISSRFGQGDSIHPDQHAMAFDALDPDIVYAANDGGVFRSPNAGDSWQSLNTGLAISEVEYLAQRPDDPRWILAGLQDNGTIRRESDNTWKQVALGDGGDCATNLDAPDVCFYSYVYMDLSRSQNRGDTWTEITPWEPKGTRALFYAPLEVNGELVVKAGEIVHLSTDSGDSWADVQLPQPQPGVRRNLASAIAIADDNRVLVGTIRGDVFRVDPNQGRWSGPVELTSPRAAWISDVLIDAGAPGRCWATFSEPGQPGLVFRSDNAGDSWTDVSANLPTIPVNAIVVDPSDADRVWVACDVGVFESRDGGGSWSVFGTGLPNALAVDLLFYEPDRLLRVGTRSRGVWEATVG